MMHVVNPVVAAILRSRFHHLLSGRLIVLSYSGMRSGRTIAVPVGYKELAPGRLRISVGNPSRKVWWRNLRGGAAVTVTLRGLAKPGVAHAQEAEPAGVTVEVQLDEPSLS